MPAIPFVLQDPSNLPLNLSATKSSHSLIMLSFKAIAVVVVSLPLLAVANPLVSFALAPYAHYYHYY